MQHEFVALVNREVISSDADHLLSVSSIFGIREFGKLNTVSGREYFLLPAWRLINQLTSLVKLQDSIISNPGKCRKPEFDCNV